MSINGSALFSSTIGDDIFGLRITSSLYRMARKESADDDDNNRLMQVDAIQ